MHFGTAMGKSEPHLALHLDLLPVAEVVAEGPRELGEKLGRQVRRGPLVLDREVELGPGPAAPAFLEAGDAGDGVVLAQRARRPERRGEESRAAIAERLDMGRHRKAEGIARNPVDCL
jgi:hypothetical protein